MAFDESGGLWFAGPGAIARLSPEQLRSTTAREETTVPETVWAGSEAEGVGLAFFPAPAGLPLYHALP